LKKGKKLVNEINGPLIKGKNNYQSDTMLKDLDYDEKIFV
jgi:hypothetical protein